MAVTYQVTGNLYDITMQPLPTKMPELLFVPSSTGLFGFSTVVESDPVPATLFPDGGFIAALADTDQMRPAGYHYTIRVRKLDPFGGFITVDYPDWKVRVPGHGGYIGDLISPALPPQPSQIWWDRDAPDPWPQGLIWVDSITGAVKRMD